MEEPCILSDHENAITEASSWIDSNFLPEINFGPNDQKGTGIQIMPDWDNIIFNSFDDYTTIELNLKIKGHFSFVPRDCREVYNNSSDRRYLQTLTRLVIKVDRGNGKTTRFFMTQIPGSEYRTENDFHCFSSTYLDMQDGYDEYILYHKINGDFANGWKYNNGDIIKSVQSNHNIDISTKSEIVCDDYLLEVLYEDCTDWWVFSGDEMVNSWTSCGYHSEYVLIYEECPSESSPGGGASGGGGEYNPPPPEPEQDPPGPYQPGPDDVFSILGLCTSIPPQNTPNTCVTTIMEYINHELCGGSINEGVYITDYLDTYGGLILTDGVALENLDEFVSRHFVSAPFNSFTDAINNGQIVMADIESDMFQSAHNVAVVGYHPDESLIYMDPATGNMRQAPASDVGLHYQIPISACK